MAIKFEDIKNQADLDAALEKERQSISTATAARYKDQQGTIDNLNNQIAELSSAKEELTQNLTKANEELFASKETPAIKEMYSKLGGNDAFFNDFMKLHGEKFKEENANQDAVFKTLTEEQKHYFTEKAPTPEQVKAAKIAGEPIGGGDPADPAPAREQSMGRRNPY